MSKYLGKRRLVKIMSEETGYDVKMKDCRYDKCRGLETLLYHNWNVKSDYNDYEIVSMNYGSDVCFKTSFSVYDEDGYVGETVDRKRIYPVFEEEKSETVEEKPAETSENCGTFSEWVDAVEFAEDMRIAMQFDDYNAPKEEKVVVEKEVTVAFPVAISDSDEEEVDWIEAMKKTVNSYPETFPKLIVKEIDPDAPQQHLVFEKEEER